MPDVASALVETKIVALSAERWTADPELCRNVVADALAQGGARFILMDSVALRRIRVTEDAGRNDGQPEMRIVLSDWLRVTAQHYVADEERIAADLARAGNATLWIEGTSFDIAALTEVLAHMRRMLFGAIQWPAAMIFILREDVLASAMDLLPGTFYVLPAIKSQRESSLYAYSVYRAARYANLAGLSGSALKGFFARGRNKTFWRKLTGSDEIDSVK